jgi:hypothetical protein
MGEIYYPIAGITIILLIGLVVSSAPATVEDLSQGAINTSELQDTTSLEGTGVSANATAETSGLVDQAGDLVSVLSKPNSGNRLLGILFTIILGGLIAWLIIVLIPG